MKYRVFYTLKRTQSVDIEVPDKLLEDGQPPQNVIDEAIRHKWSRYRTYSEIERAADEYTVVNVVPDPAGFLDCRNKGY